MRSELHERASNADDLLTLLVLSTAMLKSSTLLLVVLNKPTSREVER